ncbi:MAG: T9SS type A sorting domain-containing protein [Bacteroidetes bacterium]|nr:T9SS type A sorting domain-containing protein [Bacteroidota bacterium]
MQRYTFQTNKLQPIRKTGIYVVKIITDKEQFTLKFVKEY